MGLSVVQIMTPDSHGSGAFVARDLVVTAAHVIHPRDRDEPTASKKLAVILRDGTELTVLARLCHHRWTQSFAATGDMAIVRVEVAQPGLVIACDANPQAQHRKVTITGFFEAPRSGTVTRVAGPSGRDTLHSDDLTFHEGVSGAPVVGVDGRAIGIATRSPDDIMEGAFVGIPFLDADQEKNLSWLIRHCPPEDP